MKKYVPSNPYKRLIGEIFKRDYSIEGILCKYFGIYKDCNNNKWRTESGYIEPVEDK